MIKSRKLLTLLATVSTAACAGAQSPAPARAPVATATVLRAGPPETTLTPTPTLVAAVTPAPAPEIVSADGPLLGSNGRPACGNIQSKGSKDAQREMRAAELDRASEQLAAAALPGGDPAEIATLQAVVAHHEECLAIGA